MLKRSEDLFGVARCLYDVWLLDGQDRFSNTKCGKWMDALWALASDKYQQDIISNKIEEWVINGQ